MRYHIAHGVYRRLSALSVAFIVAINSFAASVPLFLAQTVQAAGSKTVCASSCDFTTIQDAVTAAAAGDTITVQAGTYPINSQITVNKAITLTGTAGATITTTGSGNTFRITASNVTIQNLAFQKLDTVSPQNFISVGAANTTISNNTFTGQYDIATNTHTVRGIEISPSIVDTTISNNSFTNIRQPAYINDLATGTITNNYASNTRGWVLVANSNFTFSGNTWGTNVVDIAFIPGSPNIYTCPVMDTIKANNNNPTIDNQVLTTPCPLPAPTLISPANDAVVNGAILTNSWTSVAGAAKYQYQSYNDPAALSIRYTDTYTTTQKTATNVAHGTVFWWRVRALDATDNPGAWSDLWKVSIDNNKPSIVFVAPDTNAVKNGTFSVTVTAADTTNLKRVAINIYNKTNTTMVKACGSTPANTSLNAKTYTFSCTINPTTLSDGTYVLRAGATDNANNVATVSRTISIDNTTPIITPKVNGLVMANNSFLRGTVTITEEVAEAHPKAYNVRVYKENGQVAQIDGTNVGAYNGSPAPGSALSFSLNTQKLTDQNGTNRFYAVFSARDQLDQTAGLTRWFTVDNTPPTTSISTNGTQFGGTVSPTVAIDGTIDDTNIDSYRITTTSGLDTGLLLATNGSIPQYNWDINTLPSGGYTVTLYAIDKAGNEGTSSTNISVDNTPPAITYNIENGDELSGIATVRATIDEPGTITLQFQDEKSNPATVDGVTLSNATEKQFTFDTAQLDNGEYSVTFLASDALGNQTLASTITFTVLNEEDSLSGGNTAALATAAALTAPVANIFNTTRPQALGIASTQGNTDNDTNSSGKTKAAATEKPKEKEIAAPASNTFAWYWILLFVAVLAAMYYAYRNWRLGKNE